MKLPENWTDNDFRRALVEKCFIQAETWFRRILKNPETIEVPESDESQETYLTRLEEALFDAFIRQAIATGATAFFGHAKRIIERSLQKDQHSARIKRLVDVTGVDYELIPELPFTG